MNYYDILLAKKLEDDRDPKVEGLSVTANGTYSEEGKVFKLVIVNVAGYGLADMPGGAIASFSDGAALPLNKLKVSIDPVQSGSGDPSPTNIRPITGWTECEVTVADDTTTPTVEQSYTIPFTDAQGQSVTVYGGNVDIVNGGNGNVNTKGAYVFDGNETWTKIGSDPAYYTEIQIIKDYAKRPTSITTLSGLIAEFATEDTYANVDNGLSTDNSCAIIYSNGRFVITEALYNNVSALTGKKVVFELATPSTFYTQPTSIKAIDGVNNIFADTGNILEGQYFKSL